MKKILLVFISLFFMASLLGCGKNLSFKEGGAGDVVKGFLQNVQDGNKDKANSYLLNTRNVKNEKITEDALIKKFIETKIESFEIVSEIFSLREDVKFKDVLKEKGKEFNEAKVTQILNEKLLKDFGRMVAEKSFFVKVKQDGQDKYFLVFFYSSQNLTHVTGVVEIETGSMKQYVGGIEAVSFDPAKFQEKVQTTILENI